MSIKNVVLAGAGGNIGNVILEQLIAAKTFNITILSRPGSKSTFPDGINVVRADYQDKEALVAAFRGQDAVVSATSGFVDQHVLVDACLEAGIKRFFPSEYGADYFSPAAMEVTIVEPKRKIKKYIQSKGLSYTAIVSGAFFDWGVATGFLGINVKDKKADLWDGGKGKFAATTLETIAKSVVAVLHHPEETNNRDVFVADAEVSQLDVLHEIQNQIGAQGWTTTERSIAVGKEQALKDLAAGDLMKAFPPLVYSILFTGAPEAVWGDKNETKKLGIPTFSLPEAVKMGLSQV